MAHSPQARRARSGTSGPSLSGDLWLRSGRDSRGDLENVLSGLTIGVRRDSSTDIPDDILDDSRDGSVDTSPGDLARGNAAAWCLVRFNADAPDLDEGGCECLYAFATGLTRRGAYDLLQAIEERLFPLNARDFAPHHYD